jgi:hypothetical protein
LHITPLHPKFYKPNFFYVNFAPNYIEKLIFTGIAKTTLPTTTTSMAWLRPRRNTPHARIMVKTLKLEIYLFVEFWLQIWFQKYYISSNGIQFLINKHKHRGRFLFTFPDSIRAWRVSCQIGMTPHCSWQVDYKTTTLYT